jgi:hypothetical protein
MTARPLNPDTNRTQPAKLRCAIHGCHDHPAVGTYVCFPHALSITEDFEQMLKLYASTPPETEIQKPEAAGYVYYLMVGPTTVKIGTTRNLADRVAQLRSELQYVVAVERGSFDIERARHLEFADERIDKREHFRLSAKLKAHIESLVPQRDDLIAEATARPKVSSSS